MSIRRAVNHWYIEALKLFVVLLCCIGLRYLFDSWSIAIAVSLLAYIALLALRLWQIVRWLDSGLSDDLTPGGHGVVKTIITQITTYKKNIEKSQKRQQSTVQQVTDILSAMPSATVILNKRNEIEWANYPALLLLGIDSNTDIGINIANLFRQSKFIKQLGKKKSREFEIVSPVNPDMMLMIQLAPYTDNKRLLLAHNISSHIENQNAKKTFIANASHELRTPLTVITGYLEFIQSDPELPKSLHVPVQKSLQQSANMCSLVEDLLTLSRLESKTLDKSALVQIDAQQHLNGILQTLNANNKLADYTISHSVTKGLTLYAVPKELDSVCYNLINNALKYSEKGTEIRIVWEKINKKQIKFSVTDNGIGIAPEHIAHLSKRFYRVDSGRSRRVGGTGLGLSIVKHIIERHNGHLEIHSRLGEGSTFSVILPLPRHLLLRGVCVEIVFNAFGNRLC